MRESMFSVGLQRIVSSDVDRVKEIVDTTFDTVIEWAVYIQYIQIL